MDMLRYIWKYKARSEKLKGRGEKPGLDQQIEG